MWRNNRLIRLTILPAMLLAAMTSLAAPNEEQGKLLLHKGDSLYRQGNFEEAAIAYLTSANEGNAEAQFDIAYAYFNGEGIERDYASAAMWFKRSARPWLPVWHQHATRRKVSFFGIMICIC